MLLLSPSYLVVDNDGRLWGGNDLPGGLRRRRSVRSFRQANRTAVVRELSRLGADLEAKNDAGQVPAQLTKDRLVRAVVLGLGCLPSMDEVFQTSLG